MSKIALQPNNSGTGTFTIASPDSNTNRTLTLPDEAGTVLTNSSNIESQVKTAVNASGSAPIYACRAWVNFDGSTTPPTIRQSGNISSVGRNSTGNFTVNFNTSMPDTDYVFAGTSDSTNNVDDLRIQQLTTANVRFTTQAGSSNANPVICTIAVLR
jgi:hypothetical protein